MERISLRGGRHDIDKPFYLSYEDAQTLRRALAEELDHMARMIREMENEAGWVDLAYADNQYDKTAQLRERIIAFLDGEWNEYGTSTE